MSKLLTVREVCERALRKIGAFPTYDTAAEPEHLAEAMSWLDMLVGHVAAKERQYWLVPAALTVELETGTADYLLADAVGPDAPEAGVQFPITAVYVDAAGRRRELPLWRRHEWDAREGEAAPGEPEALYIDRSAAPRLYVHPEPDQDYTVELTVQTYVSDLTRGNSERATTFRSSWNLYLVTGLAAELAAGPITRLPDAEVRGMRLRARELLDDLLAYDAHEQANEPRLTRFHDF